MMLFPLALGKGRQVHCLVRGMATLHSQKGTDGLWLDNIKRLALLRPRQGLVGYPTNWSCLIQESMILRWKDQSPGVCPLMFHTEKLMGLSEVLWLKSNPQLLCSWWEPGEQFCYIKEEWWSLVQEAVSCVCFSGCYSSTGSAIRCVILVPWRCRNEMARSQGSQEVASQI